MSERKWLKIERPKTMPSFEEFERTAREDFMVSYGLSKAEVDEYFDSEEVKERVKGKYKYFLRDVQKDPENLKYFEGRIGSLNGCLWLCY